MICMKCYKATESVVLIKVEDEEIEAGVCKGCFYEINKVIGFLLTQNVVLRNRPITERRPASEDQEEEAIVPPKAPQKKKS